jgi:hypothetical protein
MRKTVFGSGSVVTVATLEYAEYPAPFCARTRKLYVVFGWRFGTPVLVSVAAGPISAKFVELAGKYSTRIAVASGALFVHVRFTWLEETAVA